MSTIFAIAQRELKSYFASPVAYVVTGLFLVMSGYLFSAILVQSQEASMRFIMQNLSVIFLFMYGGPSQVDTFDYKPKLTADNDKPGKRPGTKLLGSKIREVKTSDGVKFVAEDDTWLMVRGSGTEPILRIYAEARSDADAAALLKLGVAMTRKV